MGVTTQGQTNDLLTSRAGLICIAQVMEQLNLVQLIDHHFPLPNSNRGFNPSVFIQTLILMQHEGSFHLDDVRQISDDWMPFINKEGKETGNQHTYGMPHWVSDYETSFTLFRF